MNVYASTFHSTPLKKYYLAFNKIGIPRLTHLPATKELGKLATYVNGFTVLVSQDKSDKLLGRLFGANHVKHGLKQLCDSDKALVPLTAKNLKQKPVCNIGRGNKLGKKGPHKRPGELKQSGKRNGPKQPNKRRNQAKENLKRRQEQRQLNKKNPKRGRNLKTQNNGTKTDGKGPNKVHGKSTRTTTMKPTPQFSTANPDGNDDNIDTNEDTNEENDSDSFGPPGSSHASFIDDDDDESDEN